MHAVTESDRQCARNILAGFARLSPPSDFMEDQVANHIAAHVAAHREDTARLDWLLHVETPALIEVPERQDCITDRSGLDHYRKLHPVV
jgi:hypothetical protein